MKARVLIEAGEFERYVIAKYYRPVAKTAADRVRNRATRAQVRRFV